MNLGSLRHICYLTVPVGQDSGHCLPWSFASESHIVYVSARARGLTLQRNASCWGNIFLLDCWSEAILSSLSHDPLHMDADSRPVCSFKAGEGEFPCNMVNSLMCCNHKNMYCNNKKRRKPSSYHTHHHIHPLTFAVCYWSLTIHGSCQCSRLGDFTNA